MHGQTIVLKEYSIIIFEIRFFMYGQIIVWEEYSIIIFES